MTSQARSKATMTKMHRQSHSTLRRAVRRIRSQGGYTLTELLVVLAILGLLIGIAVPRLISHLSHARVKTAQIQIQELGSILDIYKLELHHYPSEQQGLRALIEAPGDEPNWDGPYLKNKEA